MSATVRTNLKELGPTLSRELTKCAKHNSELVAEHMADFPRAAEVAAQDYYFQSGLKTGHGDLARETKRFTRSGGGRVTAGLKNRMVYAAIQNFGGTTEAHVIRPRVKGALAWPGMRGGPVRKVNHPGSTLKPTYFMSMPVRQAGSDMLAAIKEEISLG